MLTPQGIKDSDQEKQITQLCQETYNDLLRIKDDINKTLTDVIKNAPPSDIEKFHEITNSLWEISGIQDSLYFSKPLDKTQIDDYQNLCYMAMNKVNNLILYITDNGPFSAEEGKKFTTKLNEQAVLYVTLNEQLIQYNPGTENTDANESVLPEIKYDLSQLTPKDTLSEQLQLIHVQLELKQKEITQGKMNSASFDEITALHKALEELQRKCSREPHFQNIQDLCQTNIDICLKLQILVILDEAKMFRITSELPMTIDRLNHLRESRAAISLHISDLKTDYPLNNNRIKLFDEISAQEGSIMLQIEDDALYPSKQPSEVNELDFKIMREARIKYDEALAKFGTDDDKIGKKEFKVYINEICKDGTKQEQEFIHRYLLEVKDQLQKVIVNNPTSAVIHKLTIVNQGIEEIKDALGISAQPTPKTTDVSDIRSQKQP